MDWYICLRRLNVGPILVMKISIEYILWKSQVRNVCWYLQSEHINLKLYIWENICMGKYSNVMNNETLGTHLNWCGHNIHIHFNLKWNGYASSIICHMYVFLSLRLYTLALHFCRMKTQHWRFSKSDHGMDWLRISLIATFEVIFQPRIHF